MIVLEKKNQCLFCKAIVESVFPRLYPSHYRTKRHYVRGFYPERKPLSSNLIFCTLFTCQRNSGTASWPGGGAVTKQGPQASWTEQDQSVTTNPPPDFFLWDSQSFQWQTESLLECISSQNPPRSDPPTPNTLVSKSWWWGHNLPYGFKVFSAASPPPSEATFNNQRDSLFQWKSNEKGKLWNFTRGMLKRTE